MQFPESWLRQYVNPDIDTPTLAHKLTMAGLEVEETETVAPFFSGVVIAKIESVEPHPNADRLRICQVNDGSGQLLQIVCGAPNAAAGLVAPLARIGAVLPGNFKISKAKMRGVESFGMLCSGSELGISHDHDGLLELDAALQPGQCLREALNLDDVCFTIKLTPNRADCLSIYGVAREVAALTGASLALPQFEPVPVSSDACLPVTVQAPDLCGRFAGRVIQGVNARATTPAWMVERLERSGQRAVSALVDISNYVMLELGRPTHVFDLDRIAGPLEVRWGETGESLTLLNDQTVEINETTGVIVSNGKVESLAGIMGGEATAVTLDTTNIFLEGAFWWPEAIMGRARQYKLESEASHRFERGVDAENIVEHLEWVSRLIIDICGGQAGPLEDQQLAMPARTSVALRVARCSKVLGIPVTADEINTVFTRLGFDFQYADGVFTVVPPSFRFDLLIEEDLIEEVARIYGFERIPDALPVARANMLLQAEDHQSAHTLRNSMVALDYQEVINFSFVEESWEQKYAGNKDAIRLLNPIASQLAVMRSSLFGGLLANIQHNAHHRQSRVRVFEYGRVFKRNPAMPAGDLTVKGVEQPTMLAGAAWGPAFEEQWGISSRAVDFYDVKHDIETLLGRQAANLVCMAEAHPALHPGRSARLVLNGKNIGWLGELHPQWAQELDLNHAPVLFEIEAQALETVLIPQPRVLSRQPMVIRDLAIMVKNSLSYQAVLDTLKQAIASQAELAIVQDIRLFDVWRNPQADVSEKSLALRFWLQDPEATLDEARVENCIKHLLQVVVDTHQARLRS